MRHQAGWLRFVPVALILAFAVGCGSQIASPPPTATPGSATRTSVPLVTLAPSPTPVPGTPTDAAKKGVFRTRLVMPDGTFGVQVMLRDATGLVTGIAAPPATKPWFEAAIDNPDGRPDALLYTWLGGACDTVTTITFERTGSRFRLRATTETTGDSCILIGLGRQLLIQLDEPIDAGLVNLAED